jgi:hypothetical protein
MHSLCNSVASVVKLKGTDKRSYKLSPQGTQRTQDFYSEHSLCNSVASVVKLKGTDKKKLQIITTGNTENTGFLL